MCIHTTVTVVAILLAAILIWNPMYEEELICDGIQLETCAWHTLPENHIIPANVTLDQSNYNWTTGAYKASFSQPNQRCEWHSVDNSIFQRCAYANAEYVCDHGVRRSCYSEPRSYLTWWFSLPFSEQRSYLTWWFSLLWFNLSRAKPLMEKFFNLVHAIYFCTWSNVMYRWFERKACEQYCKDITIAPVRVIWLLVFLIVPLPFPINAILLFVGLLLRHNFWQNFKPTAMGFKYSMHEIIQRNFGTAIWLNLGSAPPPSNSPWEEWCLWGVIDGQKCVHNPAYVWSLKRGYRWKLQNNLETLRKHLYARFPFHSRTLNPWEREPYTKISQGLLLLCCLSFCRLCYAFLNLGSNPIPFLESTFLDVHPKIKSEEETSEPLAPYIAYCFAYCIFYGLVLVVINSDCTYGGTVLQGVLLWAHVLHVCVHYFQHSLDTVVCGTIPLLLLAAYVSWRVHWKKDDH